MTWTFFRTCIGDCVIVSEVQVELYCKKKPEGENAHEVHETYTTTRGHWYCSEDLCNGGPMRLSRASASFGDHVIVVTVIIAQLML